MPTINVVLPLAPSHLTRSPRTTLAALLLLACSLPGLAGPPASKPTAQSTVSDSQRLTWASLSTAQQQALSPLKDLWPQIDPLRKAKWIEIANRLPGKPKDEQQRIRERMTEWAKLTPQERGQARLNYLEAKQVASGDRKAKWEAYQALPPDRQRELAARMTAASAPAARPVGQRNATPPVRRASAASAAASAPRPMSIAPTVVKPGPGATTSLVTQRPAASIVRPSPLPARAPQPQPAASAATARNRP